MTPRTAKTRTKATISPAPRVARKHVVAALESPNKLLFFPHYAIKAYPYVGKDPHIGEFGWTISVLPRHK